MRIDVTSDEIEQGQRRDPRRCPVALAVRRALGPTPSFCVRSGSVLFTLNETRLCTRHLPTPGTNEIRVYDLSVEVVPFVFDKLWSCHLPAPVTTAIRSFDRGDAMEPFSFDLDLSCPLPAPLLLNPEGGGA